jgi:hypothetical protein
MALFTQYYNENGNTYSVLAVTNFNKADAEYYKDSWQKCYVALLQNNETEEYVVATLLGNTSWGSGYYADGIKNAIRKFNQMTEEYLMR